LIHHSDRGRQYASYAYQDLLKGYGMRASMSRSGNCYDNAYLESFFGTLKTELVHGERYRTRLEARLSIFEYVEVFYNRQRRHSALGYRSPEQYARLLNETGSSMKLNYVSTLSGKGQVVILNRRVSVIIETLGRWIKVRTTVSFIP
jgi:hypothetical protein